MGKDIKKEIIKYLPDLTKYVKSKINLYWEDVVQETLLYLLSSINNINVTNIKGLIFNTANFFIKKFYTKNTNISFVNYDSIKNLTINFECNIYKNKLNTYLIDDNQYNKLLNINKTYLKKLILFINGYSLNEIADITNININTVKTHIYKCKKILNQ